MSAELVPDRVFPCGCIEESRPVDGPPGFEVLEGEGEIEWKETWVTPCGNPDTCQHPIAIAVRDGNIFQVDEIVWEDE